MRLILVDGPIGRRENFYPISLSRPLWELRCGMSSLLDKLVAKTGATNLACFVPEYLAETYTAKTDMPVNDLAQLAGDDLLIVNPRVKAESFDVAATGPGEVGFAADGELLYARIPASEAGKLKTDSVEAMLASATEALPRADGALATWDYVWDLVLENPGQITKDFQAAGRGGIEGTVEEPSAIRGSKSEVYVGPGAVVHPMVVFDAANGPIYLDDDVEVHPYTRIEGPCYVGKKSILLGAKCREGNSIGPVCRVGGEVEESIIHGHSNKYHDGFLGHAYVGEWVNLGAQTSNSDLKNDYGSVQVMMPPKRSVDTGSTKVGALIGDHTKTSIGTLFNTGAYVGAMSLIMATGKPLAKFIPSFSWLIDGLVTKGFGRKKLYGTAEIAMSRRKCRWTDAERAMWDAIFEITAPWRDVALKKARKVMARR